MRVFLSGESLNPYYNLASEQALLEGQGDIFMLWRNGKSVIIGKNQNAYSEVNIPFCEEKGITVARRLTGGGAVFHDEGNINFSFITDSDGSGIDFRRFLLPITDILKSFGVNAEISGRNDITADGYKISGNAQTIFITPDGRKRLLHHGTLLFSADISSMVGALNVKKEKLESKGIKSVSSRVRNIALLDGYRGPSEPWALATEICSLAAGESGISALGEVEKNRISFLEKEKFSTWEWNYGSSPLFYDRVSKHFDFGIVEIGFSALHGKIEKAEISGDFFGEEDISGLCSALEGCRLTDDDIRKTVRNVGKYIKGALPENISDLLLGK